MTGSLHEPASAGQAVLAPPLLAVPEAATPSVTPRRYWNWAMGWTLIACLAAILSTCVLLIAGGKRGFFVAELALVLCLIAAFTDAYSGRIPNILTYPAILLGLALNSLGLLFHSLHWDVAATWLGSPGLQQSLLGFGACLMVALVGVLVGQVHGGDLKLLCAMGALLGITGAINTLLFAIALGLIYGTINLLFRGMLVNALRFASHRVMEFYFLRQFKSQLPDAEPHNPLHFPMAVPLALGLILAQYWQLHTGELLL